jgi:UPF0716 protein FxsA
VSGLRQRALLFGYPLVEVLTAWAVATWIGWGWTILLLLASLPVGFSIMRRAARAATAEMVAQRPPTAAHAAVFIGGLLIAIPGFVTDLLGAVLVVPLTRRLLIAVIGPALQARMVAMRVPGTGFHGDVIIGEVVVQEPTDGQYHDPQAPRPLEPPS